MRAFRRLLCALAAFTALPAAAETQLRLIGVYEAPETLGDKGTIFGGISGIDYNPRSKKWVLVSDDKSEGGPARFYFADFTYDETGIQGLRKVRNVILRDDEGRQFADPKVADVEKREVPDAESIRFVPGTSWFRPRLLWSSEGYKKGGFNARLRTIDFKGKVRPDTYRLPADVRFDPSETVGMRHNAGPEGMSFSSDGKALWVSLEGPLIEDGPLPIKGKGTVTRLMKLGDAPMQYAYPLDAIVHQRDGLQADDGISEVLAVSDTKLWVIERAGEERAKNDWAFHVKLYEVDTANALAYPLGQPLPADAVPLKKTLLVDFDGFGMKWIDNLEGMTFGPVLRNGHRSLVMVSDNNFAKNQLTQFFVFEVLP
ncbi:esterase-like activity of phytase family protein [Asticcacaulis sp. BYS171W]|uniref:Esterase-like activity of phytase family protein n=1 Tax=Asticcacaulis aquaticus TaxID=2984212 RepID=A0ABT5HUL6_9CAUL|nr:esterase-like activity of phytase family protein [Asticcacaulis aquaticus]MDC7683540.1 esterase-like activity of phytase family protein [Asticcacaulis aquaticus]